MNAALWRPAVLAALLSTLYAGAGRAESTLIVGNSPQTNDGTLSTVASLGGTYAKAVGFMIGDQAFDLDSLTLRLREQAGSNSSLTVELFGGSAGPTGPPLVTFNTPTLPNVVSDVTFTPTDPFVLQANTTYWLYLTGSSDTLNGIVWYASTPKLGLTGAATGVGARFTNAGASPSEMVASDILNTFDINGNPVIIPEPAALIPAATAILAGLAYAAWRHRRIVQ